MDCREKKLDIVTEKDLEHLLHLLDVGNANMEWQSMMDKSTPNMSYQAWRHEPEVLFAFIWMVLGTFRSNMSQLIDY